VIERARFFVTETAETTRKNIEIECICDHFSVIFFAGNQENKYVVKFDAEKADEKADVKTVKCTWRAWCNEVFKDNTSKLIQISVGVVEIAAIVTVGASVDQVVELLRRL
jgi:hypothetical protein